MYLSSGHDAIKVRGWLAPAPSSDGDSVWQSRKAAHAGCMCLLFAHSGCFGVTGILPALSWVRGLVEVQHGTCFSVSAQPHFPMHMLKDWEQLRET